MNHSVLGISLGALVLASCATSGTQVLAPYRLATGETYQDVVTIGADGTGSAPVVTQVKTFKVDKGRAELVSQAAGSAPGMTSVVVGAAVGGAASGATAGLLVRNGNVTNNNSMISSNIGVVTPPAQ